MILILLQSFLTRKAVGVYCEALSYATLLLTLTVSLKYQVLNMSFASTNVIHRTATLHPAQSIYHFTHTVICYSLTTVVDPP